MICLHTSTTNSTYLIGQVTSSFSGKERDAETCFGYFGARYYDAELMTTWLSVDPMADKYPSLSPYAYCAWDPAKLVDPDGEEIMENLDWYKDALGQVHWDANVHSQSDLTDGETYIGKTVHWFGHTDSDMGLYYHGDCNGNVSSTDMTVTIEGNRITKSSNNSVGDYVRNIEYSINKFMQHYVGDRITQFENKFEKGSQALLSSVTSAMPMVNQINAIYTIVKGEDIYGAKVERFDKTLAWISLIMGGYRSKTCALIENTSTFISAQRTYESIKHMEYQ